LLKTLGQRGAASAGRAPRGETSSRRQAEWDSLGKSFGR
jgi:hypothetical protein